MTWLNTRRDSWIRKSGICTHNYNHWTVLQVGNNLTRRRSHRMAMISWHAPLHSTHSVRLRPHVPISLRLDLLLFGTQQGDPGNSIHTSALNYQSQSWSKPIINFPLFRKPHCHCYRWANVCIYVSIEECLRRLWNVPKLIKHIFKYAPEGKKEISLTCRSRTGFRGRIRRKALCTLTSICFLLRNRSMASTSGHPRTWPKESVRPLAPSCCCKYDML